MRRNSVERCHELERVRVERKEMKIPRNAERTRAIEKGEVPEVLTRRTTELPKLIRT